MTVDDPALEAPATAGDAGPDLRVEGARVRLRADIGLLSPEAAEALAEQLRRAAAAARAASSAAAGAEERGPPPFPPAELVSPRAAG